MRIIKLATIGSYGSWLSPKGEIIDVGPQQHEVIGLGVLKEDPNYEGLTSGVYNELYDYGYIRLIYNPFSVTWRGEMNNLQKKTLGPLIANSDSETFTFSGTNFGSFHNKIDANRFLSQI